MRTLSIRGAVIALVVASAGLAPAAAGGVAAAAAPPVPTGSVLDAAVVHGVPSVPLTIDGVPVSGDRITAYNGRPLYMVASPDASSANGRLDAFTKPADFEKAVRAHGGPEHAMTPPKAWTEKPAVNGPVQTAGATPDSSVDYSGYTYIYSGDWYSYFYLGVYSGWGFPDLTQVDMFCFIWCVSWNDEASSSLADNARGQMLYEHINWSGSRLFVPGGWAAPTLSYYGWDNRVSSFGSYA